MLTLDALIIYIHLSIALLRAMQDPQVEVNEDRPLKNALTIPNQTHYNSSSNLDEEEPLIDTAPVANDSYADQNLNQQKLIQIIHNKEHSINELKLKAFQQSYDIQHMKDAMQSSDLKFKQLNETWQNKFDQIEDKRKLYEDTISEYQALKQAITHKDQENHHLLQNIKSKDTQIETCGQTIDQLKNQIIDQSLVSHYHDILTKKHKNRPLSAAQPCQNLTLRKDKFNTQQKMFKELQIKLNQSNHHKQLILTFLKDIINITCEQTTSDDEALNDYKSGDFWLNEAITLIENYPDLFEKHLVSLKDKIMHNLGTRNAQMRELSETLQRQKKDTERKNKIIRKLKFEVKQNKNRNNDSDAALNIKDQQILSNMELIETFCLSQLEYFKSESISVDKRYLLNELTKQCGDIDSKWNRLLSLFSKVSNETGNDVTDVIKRELDELDQIKCSLKVHITDMDHVLNELKRCTVYLEELIASVHDDAVNDDSETCDVALFSSTKLSLILETIEQWNQMHYDRNRSIFKYEKHSLVLQKHLYKINALLSESIHRNTASSSTQPPKNVNQSKLSNRSTDGDKSGLYLQIESLLREKLNINPTSPSSKVDTERMIEDELNVSNKSAEYVSDLMHKSEDIQWIHHTQTTEKASTASDLLVTHCAPQLIADRNDLSETVQLTKQMTNEAPCVARLPTVPNVPIVSYSRGQLKEKKKQQKKLGKMLKHKTVLLQKCNDEISSLEKQQKLIASKCKILKKRKINEIKTINKQITNILSRPNNNESSIQEMKRLGVKIVKQRLQTRDPKKQKQISKTMIQQMVQRKERVKTKYAKQIKQLNDNKIIKSTINKIEDKRDKIAQDIRSLADKFATLENEIKHIKQLSKSTVSLIGESSQQSQRMDTQRLLEIKRNLPRSMLQNEDENFTLPRISNMQLC